MVELQSSKLTTRVRFPSSPPLRTTKRNLRAARALMIGLAGSVRACDDLHNCSMSEELTKGEIARAWRESTWRVVWKSMSLFVRIVVIASLVVGLLTLSLDALWGTGRWVMGLALVALVVALFRDPKEVLGSL